MTPRETGQAVSGALLVVSALLRAKNWDIAGCQLSRITTGSTTNMAYVRAVRRLNDAVLVLYVGDNWYRSGELSLNLSVDRSDDREPVTLPPMTPLMGAKAWYAIILPPLDQPIDWAKVIEDGLAAMRDNLKLVSDTVDLAWPTQDPDSAPLTSDPEKE